MWGTREGSGESGELLLPRTRILPLRDVGSVELSPHSSLFITTRIPRAPHGRVTQQRKVIVEKVSRRPFSKLILVFGGGGGGG